MTPGGARLIILDRDGVINEDSDAFIKSVAECVPVAGSIDAIARLSKAGYTVAVATNQSGIARGLLSETTLSQIHGYLSGLVEKAGGHIAGFFYCPHGPDTNCSCRKPRPGLLYQIRDKYGSEICGVPVVGDSLRDLQAAKTAGCTPVLVRSGKGEQTLATGLPPELADSPQFANLAAFVDDLLN
ncbi:MAG: D-glycero-beta-D-manno-heptose-1,7-bisphosphate 7-phosphatase [Gammaproteobacteria bacterium]|nr:D-glycero-beta-D-manno-heptose-1,7-bisphosphate 7-phosphatase [Gammaproteobacteria bacterium]MBJ55592.1 D-glycero-beta-D-manno-heptose-1,7-bisphosphate 7-phosphatase [Gammaproteobacteria bacterium]HBN14620.1 D-glycero-beta-D-manno-heptose-1,7-bisphosphate 7-phosphatase [Pseudohongiella sp.]|tara:strand:+ start:989 stop:1543 length:555 start_codon:yes stop_codon:yes gene_type:complete